MEVCVPTGMYLQTNNPTFVIYDLIYSLGLKSDGPIKPSETLNSPSAVINKAHQC